MKLAFSIPFTKEHRKFTEETEASLKKMKIPFAFNIRENDETEESFVDYYVNDKDLDKAIVQLH